MQYKVDLHTHSLLSYDGGITAEEYSLVLEQGILDRVAITDHNEIDFALEMKEKLRERIIVGEEISTTHGHLIGLFLHRHISPGMSPLKTAQEIHAQGGIVYIPHPFEARRAGLSRSVIMDIAHFAHIIEVYNARSLDRHVEQALNLADTLRLASASGSDAHGRLGLGTAYTVLTQPPNTAKALIGALQERVLYTSPASLRSRFDPAKNKLKKALSKKTTRMNVNDILFLHNPMANEGFSERSWKIVKKQYPYLPQQPLNIFDINDLAAFITKQKPRIVVIAGGDGTINLVCQAILKLKKKPRLAVLPFGFGNALSYCLGAESIEKAIEIIHSGTDLCIDLMKTNHPEIPLGVFNISVGFDARVVHYRQYQKYIGFRSYFLSGIRGLFDHMPNELHITIDHTHVLKAPSTSLVIANCPIIGKNYVIADQARLNDGLLDCSLFSTKFAYLTNLRPKGFKHPLYSGLGRVTFKAKHIKIESEPYIQVDGTAVSHRQQLEVEVLPNAVTFLAGKLPEGQYQAYK